MLDGEYSILCNELREDFLHPEKADPKHVQQRLITTLMFCELLEHLNHHYLVVPREVVRLRKQQRFLRNLLNELADFTFASNLDQKEKVEAGLSLSLQIRQITMRANWYRIIVNRGKRVINLLSNVAHYPAFSKLLAQVDVFANPALAYFGLFFHLPRLLNHAFFLLSHTIPHQWMGNKEASASWLSRLQAQIQRRWFEMGNDAVWTGVSVLTLFVFVGGAVTGAAYLSVAAFAFDVVNASARAYIELKRLYTLHKEYRALLAKEETTEGQEFIRNHLKFIENRIQFEHTRFAIHVSGTVLILGAMALTLPFLVISPAVLLASAIFLALLWGIVFELTNQLDKYRPKETIEIAASVGKLGFFAPKGSEMVRSQRAFSRFFK